MAQKISYTERDFSGLRTELLNFTKRYYPDLIQNFNDAGVFSVFLDLNAAIGDNLHFHIDRSIQETVLQFAQQRSSLYNIARTYGLKIPGNRPSIAVSEFRITVPANGDKEDVRYLGKLAPGVKLLGGGTVFETVDEIDFASPFNSRGFPNRTKIPNFNSNNILVSYDIVKTEIIINGESRIFRRVIGVSDSRPFLTVFLPERNVLSVTSVITKDGTAFNNVPTDSEFFDSDLRWYEVKSLAESSIFIENNDVTSDTEGISPGQWTKIRQKFITEYTPENFFFLTFGGSTNERDVIDNFILNDFNIDPDQIINNLSLGVAPKPNTTMFIKYRVGGGSQSVVGPNTITRLSTFDLIINGPNPNINTVVRNSLRTTNVTSSFGGGEPPTIEEIRNLIGFNFAAQERAVTLRDYQALIRKMPGKFGAPSKVSIIQDQNKLNINLLGFNSTGQLDSAVSTTLMENVVEYLSEFRMLNDYIVIQPGEVVDLSFEITVFINRQFQQTDIVRNIITNVTDFMSNRNFEMGKNLYVGELRKVVSDVDGVINITDIKIYNESGGNYSQNEILQELSDPSTREIRIIDETIFAGGNQILQLRFPNTDIIINVR